jgi:hypothetical protein
LFGRQRCVGTPSRIPAIQGHLRDAGIKQRDEKMQTVNPHREMLGIRDILMIRIRLLSSVTLIMPKNFFSYFFYNLPAGILSSVFYIGTALNLKINFVLKFYFASIIFQPTQHLYE